MVTEVTLPKLGLTQEDGTIVRWIVPEGGRVEKGQPLFEVMTDKATLEVEAPASGVVLKIIVPEGATVPVAAPIAVIGEPGEKPAAAGVAASGAARSPAPSTDGAATTGRADGMATAGAPASPPTRPSGAAGAAGGISGAPGRVRISPRARALAEAQGVDVAALVGSGPDGRIIERDVQRAIEARASQPAAAAGAGTGTRTPAVHPTPQPSAPAQIPAGPPAALARMRAIIAQRMMESLRGAAQLTLTTEVDMADAARLREEVGAELARREGAHLTYTDIVVRAAALALRDHPKINARWEGQGVRRLAEIHVGVAVALEEGLVVPVVRHADRATLAQISAAVRDLSERARTNRLRLDEMQGGTFTVTNLGLHDVDAFTPILNPPEAAVLGVGRVHARPVAVDGRVEVRPTMVLSLTFDHRVVDGAPAAQFLQRVKHVLEHPYLLLLP